MVELNIEDGLMAVDPDLALFKGATGFFLWTIHSRIARALWLASGVTHSLRPRRAR